MESQSMGPNMEGMARPLGWQPGPNCGVTAVALAAGVPFADAWGVVRAALIGLGYKSATMKRWRGMSNQLARMLALQKFGVDYKQVVLPPRRMQLRTFVGNHAWKGRRYQVTVTGHVVTIKDGRVTDQYDEAVPIDQHPSARQIVCSALELTD